MDARALDQAFREHEGDDLCLWLHDADDVDDGDGPWIEPAAIVAFGAHGAATTAWSERLRALLSLPTIAP